MALVHLLVNPAARQGQRHQAVATRLEAAGCQVVPIRPLSVAGIRPALEQALRAGVLERLIVVGGDGLLHHTLPAVAGTDVVVAVIPTGTGNDFGRAMRLPTSLDQAVRAALGPPRAVDLISAPGGAYAASVVTAGFSSLANAAADRFPRALGGQRYTLGALAALPRLAPFPVTIGLDGDGSGRACFSHEAVLVAVANTRCFGAGMAIAPDADPTDGRLDVVVIGAVSWFTFTRMLPTVFFGRHVDHPAVTTYRAEEVSVAIDAQMWADGERFVPGPYRAAHRALRLAGTLAVVPRG
ncbi:MAG: diacylglycerol/lipid kinase family protein [Acidimicrobiales bacterium]